MAHESSNQPILACQAPRTGKKRGVLAFACLLVCPVLAFALVTWRGKGSAKADTGSPDLIIVSITSAQGIGGCPARAAGLLVTIRNQGTAAAGSFQTTLTGGLTSCAPWTLASLGAGAEHTFFCPAGMPGASEYTATVDSAGTVAESDEGNNTFTAIVWVITLPTCTPSPTATYTPTPAPTGWLGRLTVSGHVLEEGSGNAVAGAAVGGYVISRRGGGGALPVTTAQADGRYSLQSGFGVYDTDTFHLDASALGYEDGSAERSALAVYAGQPVDLTLRRIILTPTPTPTSATFLHITVALQGRPPAPHPAWQTPLRIQLYAGTALVISDTRTCDSWGVLRLTNLISGLYSLQVKGAHTLSNLKPNLSLIPGANLTHMGLLREGDCNDDEAVDILDFSLLRRLFGTSDPRGDFNNDGMVDIADFSLLRLNFGRYGPILLP